MAVPELITPNQVDVENPPVAPMGADGSGPTPAVPPKRGAHGILSGALAAASALAGPQIDAQGNVTQRHGLGPILGGILSGALTGLSAGADRSHGEAGGGLASFGRGFEAVSAQRQAAIQQAKQNQFKAQQLQQEQERTDTEKQKADQEKEQFEAQKANWTIQQIQHARDDARQDLEGVDKNNQTNRVLLDTVIKDNGKLADIPHNGEQGNEAVLLGQMTDGNLHRGPDGSLRIPIKEVNTTGLTKNEKGDWVDEKTQKPVNIEDRTTWSVYDLPKPKNEKVPTKGSVLQKIVPPSVGAVLDPDKIYDNYSLADLTALAAQTTKEANEKRRLDIDQERVNQEAAKKEKGEPLGDSSLKGEAYLGSLPDTEKNLVQSIGTGRVAADRLGYLLSKNPGLVSEVTLAYPDFDTSKVKAYEKVYNEFTSSKLNVAGGQLQSAGTALKHLNHLLDLNTSGSMLPGSPAKTAYDQQLATVVDELGRAYSASTIPGLAKIESGLASHTTWNRESAIKEAAHDLNDKLDSLKTVWSNAAPSAAYEARMPWIDKEAQDARSRLDDRYKGEARGVQPPAGANNEVYVKGQLVGHTVNGKYVPLGQ